MTSILKKRHTGDMPKGRPWEQTGDRVTRPLLRRPRTLNQEPRELEWREGTSDRKSVV